MNRSLSEIFSDDIILNQRFWDFVVKEEIFITMKMNLLKQN